MKKIKVNRNIYNIVLLFICTYGAEIVLRIIRQGSILNWPMFRMIISSLLFAIIFGNINSIPKKTKTTKILNCIYAFAITFYAWFQLGFFNFIGTYASFNSSGQAYKVTEYIFDFLRSVPWQYYFEFLTFVLLVLFYIISGPIMKKINGFEIIETKKECTKFVRLTKIMVSILILCVLYYFTLVAGFMKNRYQVENNLEVFRNPDNQSTAVDQFGISMFFVIDVNSVFFHYDSEVIVVPTKPHHDDNNSTSNSRIVDDTAWDKVIDEETNKNYITLNNYFSSRTITDKNEYTGIYKDKNVIFVLMESVNLIPFSDMVKDKFPTLNKLYNEGTTFTNFFSPRSSCSTGNNEMTAMLSLYPINNNCTANAYKSNVYPEAIFNLYRNAGYTATSYHDYIDAYYSRGKIHTNMGSQAYYNAKALNIAYNPVYEEWPSDTELFTKGVAKYINDNKFMAFMTSVTSHQPYGVDSEFGNKNLDLFNDLDISLSLKRYLSKVYELEKGLTILLDTLTQTGKLDDTVIVLFGDHYPYYFSAKHVSSILGESVMEEKNVERTPFIIYNSATAGKKVDTYASVIDVLPTVLNMFDLNYDPRLYLGTDLFDKSTRHIGTFIDGSWQSEKGVYNASTGKFEAIDETNTYTDEEIVEINTDLNAKLRMSALALKTDYMNHLFTEKIKYSPLIDTESSSSERLESSVSSQ